MSLLTLGSQWRCSYHWACLASSRENCLNSGKWTCMWVKQAVLLSKVKLPSLWPRKGKWLVNIFSFKHKTIK